MPVQVLFGTRHDPDATAAGKKRAAPAAAAPTLSDADVVQHTPWKQLAATNKVKGKSMDVLKQYLRHYKLPLSGKKADLVDRVTAHVNQS